MGQDQNFQVYRVAVLGAAGGIGKQTVLRALEQGHKVRAILRTPANLAINHPNLEIVKGDILKPECLYEYLKDQDVVVSAIGKNSFKKTVLYSQGNRNLLDALAEAGVKRAYFISASGLEVNPTHSLVVRLATKYILQRLLCNMYADLWRMENIVKESEIDWTIIRPPKLLDKQGRGKYRIALNGYLYNGLSISRADVAHFIIQSLADEAVIKKTVEIAY